MRRNGDEDLRELERAAESGDLRSAVQLHRARTRKSEVRKDTKNARFLWDTPLGQMFLTPQDERTIYIIFGSEVTLESGVRHALPPVVISRVPYRGQVHYTYFDEDGAFVAYRDPPVKPPAGPVAYRSTNLFMHRTDRFSSRNDATAAGEKKFLDTLTPLVNNWASQNKKWLLRAEANKTSDEIKSLNNDFEKAAQALAEIEDKIGKLVVHELQVERALRPWSPWVIKLKE